MSAWRLRRPTSVASWAEAHARWPGEIGYTARRILGAPKGVSELTKPVELPQSALGIDAGSGGGFLTFALAETCEQAIGIDVRRRSVWLGRHIARATDSRNVSFQRADVCEYRPPRPADLVVSNLMSHGAGDRRALLDAFRAWAREDAWLVYSEETEGYPLMEMVNAVRRRDAWELRGRAGQLLNGLLARPGFKFFQSGSANPLLERAGWRVKRQETRTWQGVPFTQTTWAVAVTPSRELDGEWPGGQGDMHGSAARLGLALAAAALPRGPLPARSEQVAGRVLSRMREPDWEVFDELAEELERSLVGEREKAEA